MIPAQAAPGPASRYGRSIDRAQRDYEDFSLFGTKGQLFGAQRRESGQLVGDVFTAGTLDELAGSMDAIRLDVAGPHRRQCIPCGARFGGQTEDQADEVLADHMLGKHTLAWTADEPAAAAAAIIRP
jgi:hypothetical protein